MAFNIQIGYSSVLSLRQTVEAIYLIQKEIIHFFVKDFNLLKVEAPLVCREESGLNDDFRMTERPIDFDISPSNLVGEILQAHTKWRRSVLERYEIKENEGLLTSTTVLRRDIKQGNNQAVVFSEIGFDQLITKNENLLFKIKEVTNKMIEIISQVEKKLLLMFPQLNQKFGKKINWTSHNELEKTMRLLTYHERLNRYTRENGVTILYGLKSVVKNDVTEISESHDVFNWDLYAKIFVYDFVLEKVICIGYCGISVDKENLKEQLAVTKETLKLKTQYDAKLATNELPMTISCGIYKSQLDLFLLEKHHISEVVSSVWDDDFLEYVNKNEIIIL